MKKRLALLLLMGMITLASSQAQSVAIALLKYGGGGDWYANPTALTNLIRFCNKNIKTPLKAEYATVEVGSAELFAYPFVHLTGHGNVIFSDKEALNLRNYLLAGGFLHVDDNYGLDPFIRREMKKVLPEVEPVELPFSHPLFHQTFTFPNGLPKVHEHDNKRPQAFAWIKEGKILCFYSYECDLGDGWEDAEVHNDSETTRLKALQMGANLLQFAFTQ